MLINFTVKNWKSFRDETTLSMLKTKEQQHKDRIPRSKDYKINILPVSAIYGANASGKSNLFSALDFAQNFVLSPSITKKYIDTHPFKLDPKMTNEPSVFAFDLLLKSIRYEYTFTITKEEVIEEKLIEILKYGKDKILFHREKGIDDPRFDKEFAKNANLRYAFENTREDILFLSKTNIDKIDNKPKVFQHMYDWFDIHLKLISPDRKYEYDDMKLSEAKILLNAVSDIIAEIDVGILNIDIMEVNITKEIAEMLDKPLPDDGTDEEKQQIQLLLDATKAFQKLIDSDTIIRRMEFNHRGRNGHTASFHETEESSGTKRLVNILPFFFKNSPVYDNGSPTIFIDEIDRSLHPLLTRKLIETFLASCSSSTRSQLIFTTHDVTLMDQDLLRRDEMWIVQKNNVGISELYSLAEFKELRYDMDIKTNYLFGRFGGIPNIRRFTLRHETNGE